MSEIALADPLSLIVLFLGLMCGAILKGATGAGLPIFAIPAIASVFDIRVAVILLTVPNFFTNLWQIIQYRGANTEPAFTANFAIAGAIGAGVGTFLLAWLPLAVLSFMAAAAVIAYVLLRVLRPSFKVPLETAKRVVFPVGSIAGALQGALGLSSPISITFMHSIKLPREQFILTMSVYFAMMSVIQVPVQLMLGLSSFNLAAMSLLALLPILVGLPVGTWVGKRMNAAAFDKTILCVLIILALKMIFDGFARF